MWVTDSPAEESDSRRGGAAPEAWEGDLPGRLFGTPPRRGSAGDRRGHGCRFARPLHGMQPDNLTGVTTNQTSF